MQTNDAVTAAPRWYRRADADQQPTSWWYYGRAIYVSRHDYKKIFFTFLAVGMPLAGVGLFTGIPIFWYLAFGLAGVGLIMLVYSLFGLYRQYGNPASAYFRRLLRLGAVEGAVTVADIHIGTYRHSYQLINLLPQATVYSIDCWQEGFSTELAIADVRALEPPPAHEPRLHPLLATDFDIPLPSASCDVIVFGFGTHEIPEDGARDKIFAEAMRILKPGGKALLFEHGIDFENYLIFGPVIKHVTRHREWLETMRTMFKGVQVDRLYAVDMIAGVKP